MSDPLDKIFLGKTQTKWFGKGKIQAYNEIITWLNKNKYPSRHFLRMFVEEKVREINEKGTGK